MCYPDRYENASVCLAEAFFIYIKKGELGHKQRLGQINGSFPREVGQILVIRADVALFHTKE